MRLDPSGRVFFEVLRGQREPYQQVGQSRNALRAFGVCKEAHLSTYITTCGRKQMHRLQVDGVLKGGLSCAS